MSSPSPLSKRVNEQITEQEINEDIQRLRVERGIARSPRQDYETEEDELNANERRDKNKMNADNNIELTGHLDYLISEAINSVVIEFKGIKYANFFKTLEKVFPGKPFTRGARYNIIQTAESNTYKFMFDFMLILLNNDNTIDENYILSLTYNIFVFSLFDIARGYKNPEITKDPNYEKTISSSVAEKINTLQEEQLYKENEMSTFLYNIKRLTIKNIRDGKSINTHDGYTNNVRFINGGKTKKRRYMRKSKNALRVKVKKQRTKRRGV